MHRRTFAYGLPAMALHLAAARSVFAQSGAPAADFWPLLADLWPRAQARGVARTTFDTAFAGVTPDPSVAALANRQPEFERPLQAYVEAALSARRLAAGSSALKQWNAPLAKIESEFGVPREIIVAVWGMESDFGTDKGSQYVVRSLATLALARPADPSLRDELLAALDILQKAAATRASLLGSWAGAMGNPQFLPSAYEKYALSFAGGRPPDIWNSVPDSLASIANFLKHFGWKRGLPWGVETIVPVGFDYATLKGDFSAWRAKEFRAAGGRVLPQAGEADLFLPAGAGGPAFLLSDNYWVIKTYNVSDSYAMSVALLGERLAGRPGVAAHWPQATSLDGKARADMQVLLARLGFYHGKMDGKLGPEAREAIHTFQRAVGFTPADGYASPALYARLRQAAQE
ncbi:MAG TPA: lytic murein transglycosylase [Beijerinckiaceae bacterium]|nr:lytic murein transglycosylase [Beijerinckiaceae bacterium]